MDGAGSFTATSRTDAYAVLSPFPVPRFSMLSVKAGSVTM